MSGSIISCESPRERLQVSPAVITKLIGRDLVLLDLQSGRYYMLAPTARVFWTEILREDSRSPILDRLSALFRAGPGQLEADLGEFSAAIRAAGLITHGLDRECRSGIPADLSVSDLPPYSKPELFLAGHVRDFTSEPLRKDE
ncbi:MAG: PqqD family protein [Acidobacteriaceae bacterium]|nr:PqqD family protein [Acidobacteriaceae bacterium]